ncbi:MAG: DUF1439 domain-containing protein [Verrucomicrobiales bacterium]|jgi:hypothetical protein|nr:DUF1439 domain-containing protein [Verrucomicrobiales bacterium]
MKILTILGWIAVTAGLVGLQGCGKTLNVEIPKSTINKAVQAKFPVSKDGLLKVTLSNPVLDFSEAKDKVIVDVDTEVSLLGLGFVSYKGHTQVEAGLGYQAADHAIRAERIKVLKVNVQGLPEGKHEEAVALIGQAVTPLLGSIALYQFDTNTTVGKLASAALKGFKVTDHSLIVIIGY